MTDSISGIYARLSHAQKGHARGAPGYSVYLNRRIGRLLAAVAHRWGWTPNVATGVSALHTFCGLAVVVLAPVTWWSGLLIATLLVLGYAWDSADGQIARLRGGGSAAGEWLDHFVDAIKHATMHLCVVVALAWHAGLDGSRWLLVPLAYSAVAVVTFFGMLLNDLLKATQGVASTHRRGGGTLARSMLLLPTDFGVLCLAFFAWGWTPVFLVIYTALAAANAAFLVLAAIKWFREMREIDRTVAAQ